MKVAISRGKYFFENQYDRYDNSYVEVNDDIQKTKPLFADT